MTYRATISTILESLRHARAEDIFYELKRRYPVVSIATIYRNIKTLEAGGHIIGFLHPDGSARYELKSNASSHQHLICKDCGKIYEIKFGFLGELSESLRSRIQFEIYQEHVSLIGKCVECK